MTLFDVRLPAEAHEVGEWPDFQERSTRADLTPAAVKAMARLAERWRVTVPEIGLLLGGLSDSSWHSWQRTTPSALTAHPGVLAARHLHRPACAPSRPAC